MKKKQNQTDPIAEAKKVLEAEEQKKRQAFADEYAALCRKYGYQIGTQLIVVPYQG